MDTRPYYLVATAGNPNFGDEFITASWLRHLAATSPDTEVWLDCPQPGMADLLFGNLHPRLRTTNTLWRAVGEAAAALSPEEVPQRVAGLVRNLGSAAYDLGLLKLREVQSLHLLGGGYVNGVWPQHAGLVAGMQAVKELTGARLYATGQGLMPLAVAEEDAAGLFGDFDYVSVRDDQSAAAFSAKRGLDDAFLGVEAEIARSDGPEGIFVCIQEDMNDEGRFHQAVASARTLIEQLTLDGTPVYYVEAIPGVDHTAYALLADLIPAENFYPFVRVWQEGLPIGPRQQWITTRFHFHFLAAAAGARGVALSVKEGYYDVKHASLTTLGSGWTVDTGNGGPLSMPKVPGTLKNSLGLRIEQKRAEAARLYPAENRPAGIRSLRSKALTALSR
ncbi:polysaccharide pyruvyl transferase family protein [Arthrobacter sp. zg-Y750]|uniref:polysaccharide pyruvyl transferase family protein n=1 Tax=Arthrobacter sp. zg-Y750 TaxID=2894189 RepID=UPI001E366825|nr:polysaccharide pyruvyl transferase family protein [Arthrobacter sp. zg-Y750]MCC9177729.1 polysaccharide pyruvyl transferase family protein [Arthrobacter sp. zg-Y750]